MKKREILSGIVIAFLIGCGSGSSGTKSNPTNKIEGKVIDGYVKNAIVCADLNKNFKCDKNEPTTISDKKGNYSLNTLNKDFILISMGGIDTEDNSKAITMYSLSKYKNITPLTSLAVKEGEKKVAQYFNIQLSEIAADPMKNNEIYNIVKNIANEIKVTGKYELPSNNTLTEANEMNTTQNETNLTNKENNETISDITEENGNENKPPQIIGDFTPPQIGETK